MFCALVSFYARTENYIITTLGNGMADIASQSNMYNATFSAGSTSASFDVFICNDNVPEGNEDFILFIERMRLTSLSPCLGVDFSEGRDQSKVTIVDDDTCK